MRYTFAILLLIHGFIHVRGFIGSKPHNITLTNILWLSTGLLFIIAALLLLIKKDIWWPPLMVAGICSQLLIFTVWQEARHGTIINIIILIIAFFKLADIVFVKKYKQEVKQAVIQTDTSVTEILTEADIAGLPLAIQNYLRYTCCLNKPKIRYFNAVFKGALRKYGSTDWMPFYSQQSNFLTPAIRLFLLRATMKRLPVTGLHYFKNGDAYMDIRLFSVFRVEYRHSDAMNIAETVTFFNDMCCLAPATLIDKRIHWIGEDANSVWAVFTNNHISIRARLYFNEVGAMVNFISEDRYAAMEDGTMKQLRWSTPLNDYRIINGYKLATKAETIYEYPDGPFRYGKFELTNIRYQ